MVGGPRNDQARFSYADILLDGRQFERAEEVAAKIEDPVYRQLIQGRMSLLRGDAAAALGPRDAAVQQWPDNPGARYLAGLAALQNGEIERAISHLREAVRANRNATDAPHLLARISLALRLRRASRFARSYVRERKERVRRATCCGRERSESRERPRRRSR
jgi:tetratricopeptide (TPR) repeat protein